MSGRRQGKTELGRKWVEKCQGRMETWLYNFNNKGIKFFLQGYLQRHVYIFFYSMDDMAPA